MADKTISTFSIGDIVAYPTNGVGRIISIEEKLLMGESQMYYNIQMPSLEMNILLPIRNAAEANLRPLSSKKEMEAAIKSLEVKKKQEQTDWKGRQNANLALLKEGSIQNIALVVNILYHRQKLRDLPIQERRLFDNALTHLTDELSLVMDMDKEKARRLVFSRLENIG